MGINGYFIQYKFIVPESIKHSSYTYQKLFRALYGYTQNVCKSSGKTYKYHRLGVLSKVPYIRSGKNCVIIPPAAFNQLTSFFKTGQNPTHYWRARGDWRAVYYMNEKSLDTPDVAKALERLLDRTYIHTPGNEPQLLVHELSVASNQAKQKATADKGYTKLLLSEAEAIVLGMWFREVYPQSQRLSSFYSTYKTLKEA